MIYTTNFGALLWPGLRAIYGIEYAQYPEEYSKVFKVETSTKYKEEDQALTGFGLVSAKAQGQGVTFDQAFQGYGKTYTHATYGLGFIVTREMYEDDQYRKISALPKALTRSVRHTVEIFAANVLNNGFSNSYTGGDGKELFATDHPLVGGGTYSNELATSADLDITSFEQALIDLGNLTDDRGLRIAIRPTKLIIPTALEFTAAQLLKSSNIPGNANNDINPALNKVSYETMHWLTDTDAWFLTTDCPNGLTFFWRRRPEFTQDKDFDSDNAKFKTTMRFSAGWTDPRGVFGSPGA